MDASSTDYLRSGVARCVDPDKNKLKPHILILVERRHFPPATQAAASRIGSFAKYWGELTRVTVITPERDAAKTRFSRIAVPVIPKLSELWRLPWILPSVLRLLRGLRIDVVFVSFPFIMELIEGYFIASRLGCPFILDIRDLPAAVLPTWYGSLPRKLFNSGMRILTEYLTRKAAAITTVTDWLSQELVNKKTHPEKIWVIRNGSEVGNFKRALNIKKELDLVYSGMLSSPVRNPQAIVSYFKVLAELLPSLRILFLSNLKTCIGREFLRSVRLAGLDRNIVVEEMVLPERLPEKLGQARLGLNSLRSAYSLQRGAIGAKEYDYLAAGLPVVELMDPDFYIESRRLILDNGVGIMNSDPELLAKETAALLRDPARLRKMSKRAREVGERFDRKKLAEDYYYKVILPVWNSYSSGR